MAANNPESPSAASRSSRIATWSLLALQVAVASIVLIGYWGYSYDDAFITYRYARHVADDGQLAYDASKATYGTSAPGYAVILGALTRATRGLGMTVPGWGSVLGVAGLLAVSLCIMGWPSLPTSCETVHPR